MERSEGAQGELPPRYSSSCASSNAFPLFNALPVEIQVKVWQAALAPRIVRWIRGREGNVFTALSGSLPLLSVCQTSRATAFLYGQYRILTGSSKVYFSPVLDYLWLDPGWAMPRASELLADDRLETLCEQVGEVQNIMVHPNWSKERMEPSVSLAKVPSIRRILVAIDEKSILMRSLTILDVIQDLKHYYYRSFGEDAATRMPYLAVGCLGWVGAERTSLWHGSEDKRQLLAVCENYGELKAYQVHVREEQWEFIQKQRFRPRKPHPLLQIRMTKEPAPPSHPSTGSEDKEENPLVTPVT